MAEIITLPARDGGGSELLDPGLVLLDVDDAPPRHWRPLDGQPGPRAVGDAALEGLIAHAAAADPEGPMHARRVGLIAAALAEALGVAPLQRRLLQRAAALHDLGKLSLPQAVLDYRHVLDTTRRRVVEQHPLFGAAMLAHAREPWLRLACSIALCHHERWDGEGYPARLAGPAIPLAARLVTVADVYDALRSRRAYKAAMPHEEALARITGGDERLTPAQFDPDVLAALRDRAALVAAIRDENADPDEMRASA